MLASIRGASAADIPAIRSIALTTWPIAYKEILTPAQLTYMLELMYSEVELAQQMTTKGHHFLLAEVDGKPIGFAGFEHRYQGEPSTRLHKLYVLPSAQGRGAGTILLLAIGTAAREMGDQQVELNVNRSNTSRFWYERRGFRITHDVVIDIGNGYVMDDHVMVKRLQHAM